MSLEKPTLGELTTIAGIIAAYDQQQQIRAEHAQGIYASALAWPACYKYSYVWRVLMSGVSIGILNHILDNAFGMGAGYFSLFWMFLVALIPLVGSTWMTAVMVALLYLWAPADKTMAANMQYFKTEVCYTTECFNSKR